MDFKKFYKKFKKYSRIVCLLTILVMVTSAYCVIQLEKTFMGRDIIKDNPFKRFVLGTPIHVQLLDFRGVIFSPRYWLEAMDKYTDDDNCRALVIRLTTPGGGITASEELAQGLIKFKKERNIPVIIYARGVAASGGYYFACAADAIVSSQSCILGSIGVIQAHVDLTRLYENESRDEGIKINAYEGAKITYFKTGLYKDMGSNVRPATDNELTMFQQILDEMCEHFLDHVMESRRHKFLEVADDLDMHRNLLAQAKPYAPIEAKQLGLIDRIGTLDDALLMAKALAGLPQDAQVRSGIYEYDGFHLEEIDNVKYMPNDTVKVQALYLGW